MFMHNSDDTAIVLMNCKGVFEYTLHQYVDDKSNAYFSSLYVAENYRKQGIASKILNMCEDLCRSLNITTLWLWVEQDSFMHTYYKNNGYVTGELKEDNLIWMNKKLDG